MKRFKDLTFAKITLAVACIVFTSCSFAYAQEDTTGETLILYYSLTGNTKAGCEALQKELKADVVEIRDLENRKGGWAYFCTAVSSLLGRHTKIEPEHPDLSSYSNIIIGSPIWTGKLSIAIRTLIDRNRFDKKKVVIYTTTNAYEKEKYKEKSRNLVRKAGGDVVGYYQVLALEEIDGKEVERTKEQIVEDTLKLVPEIKKAFALGKQTTGLKEPGFGLRPEAESQRSTAVDGFLLPPRAEHEVSGKQ
jgi:flavodoxin